MSYLRNTSRLYHVRRGGFGIERIPESVTRRIELLLEKAPPQGVAKFNTKVVNLIEPIGKRYTTLSNFVWKRIDSAETRQALSLVRYRGVTGLVVGSVLSYMFLNSHMMKLRGPDGLSRTDRHWVASKFNLHQWRIWCVPLSLFNHGDSLMHLGMNCFALCLVGPAIELALGTGALVGCFFFTGSIGAIAETFMGHHWCRGSSGGVSGLFATGAILAPHQILSIWGIWDVRAMPLALTVFGIEVVIGVFQTKSTGMAHMGHAGGMAAAIPFLYYLRWFR